MAEVIDWDVLNSDWDGKNVAWEGGSSQAFIVSLERKYPKYDRSKKILRNPISNFVEELIDSSPVSFQCSDIYHSFLSGAGFQNLPEDLNLSKYSWEIYDVNDLLYDVCESIARHGGVYIHVGYNANYQKNEFKVLPYQNCRIGLQDDTGIVQHIIYKREGWELSDFQNPKSKYDKKTSKFLPYNPDPEIIRKQVDAVKGFDQYNGQCYYFRLSNKYCYSSGLIEKVIDSAETDCELNKYYRATVKNGFHDLSFIRHQKFENKKKFEDFQDNIRKITGAGAASSALLIEDNFDARSPDGNFRFDNFKRDINPARYQHIEETLANKIRKAFKNIPPQLVDHIQGKLGATSSEDLIKAVSIYNTYTSRDRTKVERLFRQLFDNYKVEIQNDWKIKQYSLLSDGTASPENLNNPGNATS